MFSNEGRTPDQETLEYAWLIEVQLGKLSGRLTTPHIEVIVASLENFILLALDLENTLRSPHSFFYCHHGYNQFECPVYSDEYSDTDMDRKTPNSSPDLDRQLVRVCPTSEDIKYKMVRVGMDAIDIYVVESGSVLNVWVSHKIRNEAVKVIVLYKMLKNILLFFLDCAYSLCSL